MNPSKVDRRHLACLEDLPNIGKAMAESLRRIGVHLPGDLTGRDPLELYEMLCRITGARQDPCVLDVFMSVTRFMAGEPARSWWAYTSERKRRLLKRHLPGRSRPK